MKAVLFDLDGTLLTNNFDVLLEEYFRRLSTYFAQWMEPEPFVKAVMKATWAMVADRNPDRTNMEAFAEYFFADTGLDRSLWHHFDRFYEEEFPKLARLAEVDPAARQVVGEAFDRGLKVVIATNPVFPERAIRERLKWAGVADYPFDLVTHGENMHFCKPQLGYYQEIADYLGTAPENCLMVGDDPENDGSAARLGMKFHLLGQDTSLQTVLPLFDQLDQKEII